MYRLPKRHVLLLFLAVACLTAGAEVLDSLYELRGGVGEMNRKDLRIMLDGLLAEEYVDSLQCEPTLPLDEQKFNVASGMAYYYTDKNNWVFGAKACESAQRFGGMNKNKDLALDVLSLKGISYWRLGSYDEAMMAFEEMRSKAEAMNDLYHLSSALNNLASVYLSAASLQNNYASQAEQYINEAIAAEMLVPGSPGLSVRYGVACEIAVRNGKPEMALEMAQKALALDTEAHDTLKMARRYSQMGDALCALERFDDTENAYLMANSLLNEVGELTSLSINCRQLGSFYVLQGDRDKALGFLTQGLDYSRQSGYRYMSQRIMHELYKYYKGHDDSTALLWLEQSEALKDSLTTEASNDKLRDYQARYETAEKQALIDSQKLTIHRQRNTMWTFLRLIGLVIAVGAVLKAYSVARKQMAKRKSAEQEVTELRSQLKARDTILIDNITRLIEEHVSDSSLSVPALCEMLAMSQSTLTRQVKMLAGTTVQEYIQKVRMEKAAEMLKDVEASVGEVALACGYDDASYFSRVFKQSFHVSPSQYRREQAMQHSNGEDEACAPK